MSDLDFTRRESPIEGHVFVGDPYGVKNGFDHDEFYRQALVPVITGVGMKPVRADSIYGPQTIMDTVYRGIQQAEVVLIDFTGRSPNVAMEFIMASMIGKRLICLTQDDDDIPTDVRGRPRVIKYSDHYTEIDRMKEELRQQLEAIRTERTVEMVLMPMLYGSTDQVQVQVVEVTKDLAVVETLDGERNGVLRAADVEYQRIIPDMTRRFAKGDKLSGAFEVKTSGGMKFTLLAGMDDPWQRLRKEFPVGRKFAGVVQRYSDELGAFVTLDHGITGLVHVSTLAGRQLAVGHEVEVIVSRMDIERRRVGLHLLRTLGPVSPELVPHQRTAADMDLVVGQRAEGEVVKTAPEGKGGYILLRLPNRVRPVMLHCTAMTDGTRADLNAGDIEIGDIIDVAVLTVDPTNDRVTVRELQESELEQPVTDG